MRVTWTQPRHAELVSGIPPVAGRISEVQEQQQPGIDAEPLGALLLEEVGNVGSRHEMDVDVLALVAATLADPADTMNTDERKGFGQHSGRGIEVAEPLDAFGSETGFLFKLLDRGRLDRGVGVVIAHQTGRKLNAMTIGRDARLADEDQLAVMFGEDDHGADVAGAARIFPIAALERPDELAFPHQLGRRQIVEVHSSMSLSGISLVSAADRGKCWAS